MKYLLRLQKFDMDLELLEKKLNCKILEKKKDRILVETNLKNLHSFNEIMEIVILKQNWKDFKTMKDFVEDCSTIINESYNIDVRFLEKNKFSAGHIKKKLNSYLKKKGLNYSNVGKKIYIEFSGNQYRIGFLQENMINLIKTKFNLLVILENPLTVREVSDFFRVCKVFELPLIVLGGKEVENLVENAKKLTKGIDFSNFDLKVQNNLPKMKLIGFSKLSNKNENDLFEVMSDNNKIGLVFGNEKFGLSQELRDKLETYRLTKSNTKPLLASQALTYILGIYFAKHL